VTLIASGLNAASDVEQFGLANDLFENRQYDSAIVVYESILSPGMESAPLYFNLGNSYFKKGDLGHAILNYHKARRLDPADDDIIGNLEFARRFTSVQMEGVQLNPVSKLFESLVAPYRLSTLAWVSSIFFVLLFVMLTLRFGLNFHGGFIRVGLTVTLILTLSMALLTTLKYDREYLTERGVIIAEDSVIRTGPSVNSDRELDASPGLVVEILDESGEFFNVLFENKRRGWIQKSLLAVI